MIKEFFGFDGYTRTPEGFLSWQHLAFVTSLMVIMTVLALVFGRKNRSKTPAAQNKVLIAAALLIDAFELTKIILRCTFGGDPMAWMDDLPLYMCSIQLITLPVAAFSKGRLREAAVDFVCIFGVLGAVMGTYGAGQNYACYPVISFDNVISGITHTISGFASLYIMFAGMASMRKHSIGITCGIILAFSVAAYIVDITLDYNYMFLMRGDGTPYDILYNLVNGSEVLYPVGVVVLFMIYISLFYGIFYLVRRNKTRKTA